MPETLRRLGTEAALCALALGLVLLATELTLRVNDDFGRNGPEQIRLSGDDAGNSIYRGRPWYRREFANPIRLNADGYHAPAFDTDPARPVRVAVLGDSYVKGLQVSREANLTAIAQEQLPTVQVLALGGSARFLPRQLDFFRAGFEELFGPQGRHGDVDGVVFCVRSHSVRHVAEGSTSYDGFPQLDPPWQFRLKSLGHDARVQPWRRALRSPSHALSLLGHRVDQALESDLRHAAYVPSEADVGRAVAQMREIVIEPAVELARERGLAVGFLYLPSVSEAQGGGSRIELAAHWGLVEVFDELGVAFADAGTQLADPTAMFFPSDRHPNQAGHRVFGARLAALIRTLPLPSGS